MGSSESSETATYGWIFVRTEKPIYNPGQQVSGAVILNIKNPYPGNSINLQIKGKQKADWIELLSIPAGKHGEMKNPIHRGGKIKLFESTIKIHKFQQVCQVPIGQYTYPFSFLLPMGIPGSYSEKMQNYQGKIKYSLKAYLPALQTGLKIPTMKHKSEFLVHEIEKSIDKLAGEMEVYPKSFFCLSKGNSKMKCSIDKTIFLAGEKATINIKIDNSKCKLDITSIDWKLVKYAHYSRQKDKDFEDYKIVSEAKLGGIKAGEEAVGQQSKKLEVSLTAPNNSILISPCTNGELIKNYYYVQVNAQLAGCCLCCSQNLETKTYIVIVPPNPQGFGAEWLPPGWSPQTFPVYNVAIPPVSQDVIYNLQNPFSKNQYEEVEMK